jgi:hypothetical protein
LPLDSDIVGGFNHSDPGGGFPNELNILFGVKIRSKGNFKASVVPPVDEKFGPALRETRYFDRYRES